MRTQNTGPVETGDVIRRAVEDAVQAPSIHNTQPWRFGVHGTRISLRADPDRRLDVADPDGREMLISCGAALYNLRLSLRAQGFEPVVRTLPDPDRPHLLADVHLGRGPGRADEAAAREYEQLRRRRTHRGGFRPDPVSPAVLTALQQAAEQQGARLIQAVDPHVKAALAALTDAAEHVQRRTASYSSELARWAPTPDTARADGVQQGAYPARTPHTEPDFPGRDFARGHDWGVRTPADEGTALTGVVLLLGTRDDTPAAWLNAGQALEHVLLLAAEHGLAAAFHTQELEVPELREFVHGRFCGGAHPQMLLRLGVPGGEELSTVRRPVDDVLSEEP